MVKFEDFRLEVLDCLTSKLHLQNLAKVVSRLLLDGEEVRSRAGEVCPVHEKLFSIELVDRVFRVHEILDEVEIVSLVGIRQLLLSFAV